MNDNRPDSLFWQLGKDTENQLSRTFAACFNASSFFRHEIVRLLHQTCQVAQDRRGHGTWECATEVQTPRPGGGRLDLRFALAGSERKASAPVFVIENKVGSTLRREQLLRYKRHKVEHLIAVTKHPPEVSTRQMRRDGVFALRWQDFHHVLSASQPKSPVDRFIVNQFIAYLEDLNMAYPESLNASDLKMCRRLFEVAATNKRYKGFDPKNSFATADHCLEFLGELRRQLIERVPELEGSRWWGPKMFVWRRNVEDDPAMHSFHVLGIELHGRPANAVRFECGLYFPRARRAGIEWRIGVYGTRVKREQYELISLAQSTDRKGAVQQDVLLDALVRAARRWRVPQLILRRSAR